MLLSHQSKTCHLEDVRGIGQRGRQDAGDHSAEDVDDHGLVCHQTNINTFENKQNEEEKNKNKYVRGVVLTFWVTDKKPLQGVIGSDLDGPVRCLSQECR